jgi:phosphopantothenoylcysteine decarboxylase/phosphopantothenate--cysteine ligase
MSDSAPRRILLGITGGIAAYKAAELVRLLRKQGCEVRVVMTDAATQFITPMTLQALSGNPVRTSLFDEMHEAAMGHIELARWADQVLVAPASADFMARLAAGMANDLLTTLCLATRAPVALAPAMNQAMWSNPATQANVRTLRQRDISLWGPAEGDQACGENGPGRMLEPSELLAQLDGNRQAGVLSGVHVLLTAGPTWEAIDPVRYVGNRSSGKMGFALAGAFRDVGAEVVLVSGPVGLPTPGGVRRIDVESASEMLDAVMAEVTQQDIFVACAAVADYRPRQVADQKIKKEQASLSIDMTRNEDILAAVAALDEAPFTVGFAAETQDAVAYAEGKRQAKGVDMVAANLVGAAEGGFGRDENALTVVWEGGRREMPMAPKSEIATNLVALIAEHYAETD